MRALAAILATLLCSVALAEQDGGVAIWAHCEDFSPDAGDIAQQLDGGAWLLSRDRARYDACKLGAAGKCSELLAGFDAGTVAPEDHATLHLVSAILSGAAAAFTAYSANRTARHLGLWP